MFGQLLDAYSQVEHIIASGDPKSIDTLNEKLSDLATFMRYNDKGIESELFKYKDRISLIKRIDQIKTKDPKAIPIVARIHNSCALLELKVLLNNNDTDKLIDWIQKNKEGVFSEFPSELLEDLSESRKLLNKANLLTPEVDKALSNLTSMGVSSSSILNTFIVDPVELEKDPKGVLLKLGDVVLQNNSMPKIIYLNPVTKKPTLAIDTGGLKRQLVATLCDNLFKQGSNFAFVKEEGYDIPICNTANDLIALRTFGRLLGLAAISPVPTGTNLAPSFFYSLFALSDQELETIPPLSEPLKQKLFMARQGMPMESFDNDYADDMTQDTGLLTATAIVAKELKTLLGPKFRQCGENVEAFIKKVQGIPATKENFKQMIVCENDKFKEWLNQFIDDFPHTVKKRNKEETYELKHFAMLLTGSFSLNEDKFEFEVHPHRKFLESETTISTCEKKMELPGDLTKDELHQELKEQLSLMKSFNAA